MKTDDVLDVRDVIVRFEELEDTAERNADENDELAEITSFLDALYGSDGDHQWRGEWYPVTLVRDSYFTRYAEELAEEIGAIPENTRWPFTCIDWEKAARELQMDYSSAELAGVTYWFRS